MTLNNQTLHFIKVNLQCDSLVPWFGHLIIYFDQEKRVVRLAGESSC